MAREDKTVSVSRLCMAKLIVVLLLFASASCGPNQRILNSAAEPSVNSPVASPSDARPAVSSFEQDLNSMRTADFNFIHVFRRKDGSVLDPDDRKFMAGVIPSEVNRRKISDEGKAVIIGSNYRIPEEIMKVLVGRFEFADFSKPESEIIQQSNR